MAEITDEASAYAWLKTQDHQTQVWFATRCALRTLPNLGTWKAATSSGLAFASLRATLIAAAAARCPAAEMRAFKEAAHSAFSAAESAFSAANSAHVATQSALSVALSAANSARSAANSAHGATHSTLSAADSAYSAAFSADSAYSAAFSAASAADSAFSAASRDANNPLNWEPLWGDIDPPSAVAQAWQDLKTQWDADAADWSFWIDWYEGILNGDPLPWKLTQRIALEISEDEWDAGQAVVAERINEIRAEFVSDAVPQAETITQDADNKYIVRALVADPDAMIDRIFKQLDFSLSIALRGHNMSGFNDMCTAYQYLDHTRQNCRDDPNAVHMHLRLAREILQSRLETREYGVEDGLVALVSALERHEVQLRADHPEVRKAHETFVAQRLRELDDEKRLRIAAEFKSLSEDSKDRLSTEFVLDAQVLETSTGIEAQTDALKRSGGRSQKMALVERAAAATKAIDGSAANKGVGILFKLEKLGELLSSLF